MNRLGCTTMIAGKKATPDGSVIVAHSDDDVADERVIFVPARKWDLNNKTESARNVYYDNCSLGPDTTYNSTDIRRYIGNDRGPGYQTQSEGHKESVPLGSIPQVSETYAYFDCNYGIMNEHSVMIGECTCGAKIHPNPEPGKRLFYAAELSRVALERSKTAIEAIGVMADMIANYGYYGTGETLLVGDSDEAWVMEMCGYSMDGNDGIWVARRVPDDEYFVAANEFRIRDVYMDEAERNKRPVTEPYYSSNDPNAIIIYSKNLFSACKGKGWIDQNATNLDWLQTVSHGEYSHPYYSLRRVWRAFSKASPVSHLPSKVEDGYTRSYPFSLKPDKKLGVLDIAEIYRDQYEGTEFDLTTGIAAGPFGNPVRYDVNPDQGDTFNLSTYTPEGAWERPISIYRCGVMWINQAKKVSKETIGISWIGFDRPIANCLMPFYTRMSNLPESIQTMNILDFDFGGKSAWWAFNFVANYLNLNFSWMLKDLNFVRNRLESEAATTISKAIASGKTGSLERFCVANTKKVLAEWWRLAKKLIVTYNDGARTTGPNNVMDKIDYPKRWLKLSGFYDGPTEY